MSKLEVLKTTLLNAVDQIDCGNSDMSDENINDALDIINQLVNTKTRLSKYQACKYLNISRATFDNWVKEGKIPPGTKTQGFKELS